jgi:hypothetical protein
MRKKKVKDKVWTPTDKFIHLSSSSSSSTSASVRKGDLKGKGGSNVLGFNWPSWTTPQFQSVFDEWQQVRRAMGKKPKNWHRMFQKQLDYLDQFGINGAIESINASIRNNWQGLFEPTKSKQHPNKPPPKPWQNFDKAGRRVDDSGRIMDSNQIRQEDEYFEMMEKRKGNTK